MALRLVPPGVSPWTREAARRIVRDLLAEGKHPTRLDGWVPWPDHVNGRCVDVMLPTTEEVDWCARYLVRHAEQLRVHLIISNRRIWRSYWRGPLRARRWHRYWGSNPHRDHVHVEFKQ
jgi:hypothetical protein